jgi:hypothetical protein
MAYVVEVYSFERYLGCLDERGRIVDVDSANEFVDLDDAEKGKIDFERDAANTLRTIVLEVEA